MSLDEFGRHGGQDRSGQPYVREMPLGNGLYVTAGTVVASVLQFSGPNGAAVTAALPPANGLPDEADRLRRWLDVSFGDRQPAQVKAGQDQLDGDWQRERVGADGRAYVYKLTDSCGGGLTLNNCPLSQPMLRAARLEVRSVVNVPFEPIEGSWQAASAVRSCEACHLYVQADRQVVDGRPTGFTRVAQAIDRLLSDSS